ncbi:hypothetical protein [Amphibacillus jilinensis]|nr:hypothetical protein [Amphibacillus jilinensis]
MTEKDKSYQMTVSLAKELLKDKHAYLTREGKKRLEALVSKK